MSNHETTAIRKCAVRRERLLRETSEATRELRAAVRVAVKGGLTESEAARLAGVTRVTVRAWLGK